MQRIWRWAGWTLAVLLAALPVQGQSIYDAVRAGSTDEVGQMIAADTSLINASDDGGNTLLHIACQAGSQETAQMLIDAGAAVNPVNKRGETPLRVAVRSMNTDVVALLLDHAATTDDVHPMFGSVMNQAFQVTCQNQGDARLIELLLGRGLAWDPNKVDALGMTPLDWAVHFGNLGMAVLALDHGADVNHVSQRLGRSPLVGAVSGGHEELAAVLLSRGADVAIVDQYDNPPIFYAVSKGRIGILRRLLARGASTGFQEPHYGRGLLHLAAISGFRDVAEALVERGGPIDAVDASGKTPLYYAIKYGNRSTADYLAAEGAAAPQSAPAGDAVPPWVSGGIVPDQASIWYLNHRGWTVATQDHLLVFDAEEFGVRRSDNACFANGFLTADELSQENVVALYSCYHGQPSEPAYIHTLADSLADIAYVHLEDDAWRGSPNTTYLQAYADTAVGDVTVQTISIADYMPMLAYLCHVDGLSIYYQAFRTDSPDTLRARLEYLDKFVDTVDVAFLPLPEPEQEEPDLRLFLEKFPTRSVVLVDANRREHLFPATARRVAEWGYSSRVLCAENPGDHFVHRSPAR